MENNFNTDFDELGDLFGMDNTINEKDAKRLEKETEGFANCFPDWDLHPPV